MDFLHKSMHFSRGPLSLTQYMRYDPGTSIHPSLNLQHSRAAHNFFEAGFMASLKETDEAQRCGRNDCACAADLAKPSNPLTWHLASRGIFAQVETMEGAELEEAIMVFCLPKRNFCVQNCPEMAYIPYHTTKSCCFPSEHDYFEAVGVPRVWTASFGYHLVACKLWMQKD